MKIALGADHGGYSLKEEIKSYLNSRQIVYEDFGTFNTDSVDYPRIAEKVCKAILSGQYDLGFLFCGTGIGMSIAANKFHGIRAAACSEPFSAIFSRRHNNANVLCMGGRVVGPGFGTLIAEGFINARFETGGRHERRVDMITRLEQHGFVEPTTHSVPSGGSKTDDTHPIHTGANPIS